jgi:hypothetical protein
MPKIFILLLINLFIASNLYAAQSSITEAEGTACMGEDRSKKQTEKLAFEDAKRKAVEYTLTYLKSETVVNKYELEKDLIEAYSNAAIKIIQEMEKKWYKDESLGDCMKVKIKAEVIPDEKGMERIAQNKESGDDPSAPLNVKVWTDKKEYKGSEKIKVYIKGNKPFYARVVYKDAGGNMAQLLPNPHRSDNYFNGGTIYEIPSGKDRFELEVSPPFGSENVIVYAGSSQVGDVDVKASGGIYEIKTKAEDVGIQSRGVLVKVTGKEQKITPAEFSEVSVVVKTGER